MKPLIPAIVLAAGASVRLGQPKQLLALGGETLLARAARLASEAGASPIFIVLGANADLIRLSLPMTEALIPIVNESWEQGISTSIHAGLNALDATAPDAIGVLIMTCDQPRLTSSHLKNVVEAFSAQTLPSSVASSYAGIIGTPALFPRHAFSELRNLRGDKGARALLANPPCALVQVPFPGGEIDIDRPGDLVHLR